MNKQQLEVGNSISQDINRLQKQLDYWERATDFVNQIRVRTEDSKWEDVDAENIPFDVAKSLAISKLQSDIKKLTKEFEEL